MLAYLDRVVLIDFAKFLRIKADFFIYCSFYSVFIQGKPFVLVTRLAIVFLLMCNLITFYMCKN